MNSNYSTIFILLYLTGIMCNGTNIATLLPIYGSNIDTMVSTLSRIVTAIENNHLNKASLIKIILPAVNENTIMAQIIEKTAQKVAENWLTTTNDSFCCDSYKIRVFLMNKSTMEYTPDFYIIPLRKHDGLHYLEAQLNVMSEEKSFNPRATFLLVTLTDQCGKYQDNNLTNPYFDHMWRKNYMSLFILVMSECDFQTTIITATPFSDNNVCRKVQENGTVQLNPEWNDEEIAINVYKNNQKNFNKCLFSVGTIHTPPYVVGKPINNAKEVRYDFVGGIDLELLHLVSTKYNFTYEFDVHHGYDTDALSRMLPNGSIAGILVDVLLKKIDISIGGFIPYSYNYLRYDYSGYYKFSSFIWVVNNANLAPQWKIFFGTFSQNVWIISGLVFIVTSFLYSFFDKSVGSHDNCGKKMCCYCKIQAMPVIQYFGVTLGLSSTLKPKSPCLRVLYFSWNIYSLHMCIAYSSMLFLLMSNPPLEKEINTVEDIKNAGLKIGSKGEVYQRLFFVELDGTIRNMLKESNSFVCPSWKSCIEDLIKHKNFSLLTMQDLLEYYVDPLQSNIHRISETFFSVGACVMASKGSPLLSAFEELTALALQFGLVEKWERVTKSKFQKVNVKDGLTGSEKSATALTFSDLRGTFFVLMVGIVISLMLLFGELVVNFLQRKIYHRQQNRVKPILVG